MDNSALYLEYSDDRTVYVVKITDGARNLWLTREEDGYGRDVIRIGKSEVETTTVSVMRHYMNLTDSSNVALIFDISKGKLEVR
ncbi:MAG: hypothetical protein ACR5K2_02615 [Wolbachia sp.]